MEKIEFKTENITKGCSSQVNLLFRQFNFQLYPSQYTVNLAIDCIPGIQSKFKLIVSNAIHAKDFGIPATTILTVYIV